MEQLLSIKSVPISIEIKSVKAKLQVSSDGPKLNISRTPKGLTMRSEPIRVQIDQTAARASAGIVSTAKSMEQFASESVRISYEGIANIVDDGNAMASGTTIPDIAASRFAKTIDTMLAFLPSVGPDISWAGGTLNLNYEMDDMDMSWQTPGANIQFIPGSIEISVAEFPRVVIEYIGEPLYVPPSANPNAKAVPILDGVV